jgi:uncharacterized protein (DUF2252 family)
MTDTLERPSDPTDAGAVDHAAIGKKARAAVSRASHGDFPTPDRDPIALLEEQARTRVEELVPLRYQRMSANPFAFFRGAALVMATDLARVPHTALTAQICGDAHLANFGIFATPERRLVFDLNDFDETLPGPFEWDVKRFAASVEIAARENGFNRKTREATVLAGVQRYREAMREFAAMRTLDVWYSRVETDTVLATIGQRLTLKEQRRAETQLERARSRDSLRALAKLTEVVDGQARFVSDPPLLVPLRELLSEADERDAIVSSITDLIGRYSQSLEADRRVLVGEYRFVDLARKVVGVGSVGTRCWVALFLGRDSDDPLVLQVKEAEASVLERFLEPSKYGNHGHRVVNGQRLMQASSDLFLGWDRASGVDGVARDYYLRQLLDGKLSIRVDTLRPSGMRLYSEFCGWTLARAHARSGDRVAIASYLGTSDAFDRAIVRFATAYGDQNERDHRGLVDAIASGRVNAKVD